MTKRSTNYAQLHGKYERLAVVCTVALTCALPLRTNAQPPVFETVTEGATFQFGGSHAISAPDSGRDEWIAARDELDLGRSSLAWNGRSPQELQNALQRLQTPALLRWEVALIAAHAEQANISNSSANRWIQALSSDNRDTEMLFGTAMRNRMLDRGSLLGTLPPQCFASLNNDGLVALEQIATVETRAPARRLQQPLDDDEVVASVEALETLSSEPALQSVAKRALFRTLSSIPERLVDAGRATTTNETTNDDLDAVTTGAACELDSVTNLLALEESLASGDTPAIATAAQQLSRLRGDAPITAKVCWRVAILSWLAVSPTSMEAVVQVCEAGGELEQFDAILLSALADAIDGVVAADRSSWPTDAMVTNPTYAWAVAEHARVLGSYERAELLARWAVEADPGAPQAWLSLASTALRQGNLAVAWASARGLQDRATRVATIAHWRAELEHALASQPEGF